MMTTFHLLRIIYLCCVHLEMLLLVSVPTSFQTCLIFVLGHQAMLLERQVLHRDISLGNIMFDHAGGIGNTGRLIDFDLAKRIAVGDQLFMTPGDFRTVRSVHVCYTSDGWLMHC